MTVLGQIALTAGTTLWVGLMGLPGLVPPVSSLSYKIGIISGAIVAICALILLGCMYAVIWGVR